MDLDRDIASDSFQIYPSPYPRKGRVLRLEVTTVTVSLFFIQMQKQALHLLRDEAPKVPAQAEVYQHSMSYRIKLHALESKAKAIGLHLVKKS